VRAHGLALAAIAVVPLAPLELLRVLTDREYSDVIPNEAARLGISVGIGVVAFAWVAGANVAYLAARERGEQLNPLAALGRVERMGSLIAANWLLYLAVLFGLLALVVPGLIALGRWIGAVPAVVVERRSVGEALGRSNALARGHTFRCAFAAIVVFLIAFVVATVGYGLLAGLLPTIPGEWLGTLALDVCLLVAFGTTSYAIFTSLAAEVVESEA
jgi:hypothetical protein